MQWAEWLRDAGCIVHTPDLYDGVVCDRMDAIRTVPVQSHFAEKDPLRDQKVINSFASRVRTSGATFQQYDYTASGHLFADRDNACL